MGSIRFRKSWDHYDGNLISLPYYPRGKSARTPCCKLITA